MNHPLRVQTDIVGFPIHENYNHERLLQLYFCGLVLFPVLTLFIHLALNWLAARLGWAAPVFGRPFRVVAPALEEEVARPRAATAGRMAVVGAALGLEAAIAGGASGARVWIVAVAAIAVYALVAVAASVALGRRWRDRPWAALSAVNAIGVGLVVAGLYFVSASTKVSILSDHSVRHFPWLSWPLAIFLTLATLAVVTLRLRAATTREAVGRVERRVVFFVAGGILLFLLEAIVIGIMAPIDVFHDGERLAAAALLADGLFPWRDLLSTHGLLEDSLTPLVGLNLFEASRWGEMTGRTFLATPLYAVFLFLLGARLMERNWALVAALGVLLLSNVLGRLDGSRFMFWPLILLLLAAVLSRSSRALGFGLGAALALQAILVPESAYCVPAVAAVVVLFEAYQRRGGASAWRALERTRWALAGGAAVFAVFLLLLIAEGALDSFILYYLIVAPGHALTGAIPAHFDQWDLPFTILALSPPAALLLAVLYYATKVIGRKPLTIADWVAAASGLFALAYYTKFLGRADYGHAEQSYDAAIPLLAYMAYVGCGVVEDRLRRLEWARLFTTRVLARPLSLAVLLGLVATLDGPWPARVQDVPSHFSTVALMPPPIARVGYQNPGLLDRETVDDLAAIVGAYLGPNDWLYDFSNEPGLFYFVLGLRPRTRYYQVSLAIPEAAQKDLISQLQRERPRLIVFTNSELGLPTWDGIPNSVRHYDVSQYILDNYTPLLTSHTQVIYADRSASLSAATAQALDLHEKVSTDDLYFRANACDWGYAPNFLVISPPARPGPGGPLTLAAPPATPGPVTLAGWAVDRATTTPPATIVVLAGGTVVFEGPPNSERADIAAVLGSPAVLQSGFRIGVPSLLVEDGTGRYKPLRVFGVTANGIATELGYGPGTAGHAAASSTARSTELRLRSGRVVPVKSGPVEGIVDGISLPAPAAQLTLPAGAAWADYRWLEVDVAGRLENDRWILSDSAVANPSREVQFNSLPASGTHLRVFVGPCSQWRGFGSGPLRLSHTGHQPLVAVRLLA